MYLSDRDLKYAIETGRLIVNPAPEEYDTTSIDLHLDEITQAKVWNIDAYVTSQQSSGSPTWVRTGKYNFRSFSAKYFQDISTTRTEKVYRDGDRVILKPGGFFLWQTVEKVGTPEEDPRFICFINGKSSSARAGLLVHMTAPTIHAGWWGKITLEIANLGPFDLCLEPGDAISQIVVATISSPPSIPKNTKGIAIGQKGVGGIST